VALYDNPIPSDSPGLAIRSDESLAIEFTSPIGGYLDNATLPLCAQSSSQTLTVDLYTEVGGQPASLVASLTSPGPIAAPSSYSLSDYTFTAPPDTALEYRPSFALRKGSTAYLQRSAAPSCVS